MIPHDQLDNQALRQLIRTGKIQLGGNTKLKIYGLLSCTSGKRMKRINRVFFASEHEAIKLGYRPCGHCIRDKYLVWKQKKLFRS